MKYFITAILFAFLQNVVLSDDNPKIIIHVTGYVLKPGTYKIAKTSTPKEIQQLCGGYEPTWAATNRVIIMSFSRQANRAMETPAVEKDIKRVYDFGKEDQKIELQNDDVIFIPMKRWVGR